VSASVDERDEHLMLLEAARHHLEVEWTETLAAADAEGDHDVFGYPSTVAYLRDRLRMAGGRAHRYVRNARMALRFRATFSAWKHRQLSSDQAELLFAAAERMPDKYPQAETVLLEIVGDSVAETRQILDYWRHQADPPGVRLDLEDQLQRRRLDVTRDSNNGMVTGDFALPSLEGESLLTAIDALMPPPADDETRTTTQRRADALGDLARSFLEGAQAPMVGGERPHLSVHTDLKALQGHAGGLHESEDGVVLDPELIRLLACDGAITRIVFGPGSEVLEVGRKTRVVPAGMRRALVARDRRCMRRGCTRPARWCDAHHIIFWADGGMTVIDNLCLLCRYHHTQIHLGLITLEDLDLSPSLPTAATTQIGASSPAPTGPAPQMKMVCAPSEISMKSLALMIPSTRS
jgi:hypothetical protein